MPQARGSCTTQEQRRQPRQTRPCSPRPARVPWHRLVAASMASCSMMSGRSPASEACAGPSPGSSHVTSWCLKLQIARATAAQSTMQQQAHVRKTALTPAVSPWPAAAPMSTVAALGEPFMTMKSQSEAPAAATCAASSGPSRSPPASRVKASQAHQSRPYIPVLGKPNLAYSARPRGEIAGKRQGHHQPRQLGHGAYHVA
mmetsp:Transcript_42261/g.134225  ORF Transcript_42261/g.134225 Transcript_42261/m.134225 type:complete len:201 (+) Transcript_42261:534-1136(+)